MRQQYQFIVGLVVAIAAFNMVVDCRYYAIGKNSVKGFEEKTGSFSELFAFNYTLPEYHALTMFVGCSIDHKRAVAYMAVEDVLMREAVVLVKLDLKEKRVVVSRIHGNFGIMYLHLDPVSDQLYAVGRVVNRFVVNRFETDGLNFVEQIADITEYGHPGMSFFANTKNQTFTYLSERLGRLQFTVFNYVKGEVTASSPFALNSNPSMFMYDQPSQTLVTAVQTGSNQPLYALKLDPVTSQIAGHNITLTTHEYTGNAYAYGAVNSERREALLVIGGFSRGSDYFNVAIMNIDTLELTSRRDCTENLRNTQLFYMEDD